MGSVRRIAVIGNSCGGKTWLSRRLAEANGLPLTHSDSLQFDQQLQIRPHQETIRILKVIQAHPSWIIDGFGPLDILLERLSLADEIILIDMPLWRHYWWCIKRQTLNVWKPRSELPKGASEISWHHTKKLFKTIWQQHHKMRPELLRILQREAFRSKVRIITNPRELREFNLAT